MTQETAEAELRAFIDAPDFPCLAGKGVVNHEGLHVRLYDSMGSATHAADLAQDLSAFAANQIEPRDDDTGFTAFAAVFDGEAPPSEEAFETLLWQELQQLHTNDAYNEWDPSVSADPDDPRFAFSFAGHAFFVIGLHPSSSRLARRFSRPALVFNPHGQFDLLRSDGRFDLLREAVRERDIALQGSVNPMLTDFGVISEARQYSGRVTPTSWKCPFHRDRA